MDTAFNPKLGRGFLQPVVKAMTEQRDGKLLIGGEFTACLGRSRSHPGRLNADSGLDLGFESVSL